MRTTPSPADASIIDVTGQEQPLRFAPAITPPSSERVPIPIPAFSSPDYGYEQPRLGKKYRKQLGLNSQQVEWLDKFWSPQNVFLAIEGCCVATIRLYVQALAALDTRLAQRGSSLAQEAAWCQQESIRLGKAATTYGWNHYEEQYVRELADSVLYSTLFRRCENLVREVYGNKRKLAAEFSGLEAATSAQLEARLGGLLNDILPTLAAAVPAPDEATEQALNLQNVTRWKAQLEELTTHLSASTTQAFSAGVYQLGQRNARNPAIENIFFDASKLIAKYDREEALRFYLHYVYHDLHSATINNKPLAKTIQKSLFPQPEQLQRFEEVIRQLITDKDLVQALAQVPTVYARHRKKIHLDAGTIRAVQHQHAGTVELLNDYLQDEPEQDPGKVPAALPEAAEVSDAYEISLAVPTPAAAPVEEPGTSSPVGAGWGLTPTQRALLTHFAAQGLTLPQAAVEAFARQHGALRNQLIDGINEKCYERLDDVLIEEDGDQYTIYSSYYQQLSAPC